MGFVVAETERLRLREWREGDADTFERHTNNEQVMRFLGGVKTPEFLEGVVRERFMLWQEELGFTFWVVEQKEDGEFLGFCGLKRADGVNSPIAGEMEIGWRFREDAWGKGYARESAAASLELAFHRFGASEVFAVTVEGNAASWGLMLRLGMRRREDLDYVDPTWPVTMKPVIVYSIARDAWKGC